MQQESKKKFKVDPELKKKMKAIEDKIRQEAIDLAPVSVQSLEDKISFDQWWMMANSSGKMRAHLKEVLFADFKARGLSKLETKARYDDALKVFGIEL